MQTLAGEPSIEWRQILFGPDPRRTLKRVVVLSSMAFMFFQECLLPIQIIGSSMQPTYRDGQFNFINRMAYTRATPCSGDVVVVRHGGELMLKRIVGCPGDTVAIDDGAILVNGQPLSDSFARQRVLEDMPEALLGPAEFFVIGDNREISFFGTVLRREIVGKILF
jgi:signal peptidase I